MPQVLDLRHLESQVLNEEAASDQGSVVGGHTEVARRATALPHIGAGHTDASPMYSFNMSFEELSGVGLDEASRHGHVPWMVIRNEQLLSVNFNQSNFIYRELSYNSRDAEFLKRSVPAVGTDLIKDLLFSRESDDKSSSS